MSILMVAGLAMELASAVQSDAQYASARSRAWRVGDEREIRAGTYARLFDEFDGWRIWREEWATGVACAAVKPAEGIKHPTIFSTKAFRGEFPAIHLLSGKPMGKPRRIEWRVVGEWPNPSTEEFRQVGERFDTARPSFFAEADAFQRLLSRDGERVEVHVVSWQYPSIYEGRSESTGVVELSGLDRAIQKVEECEVN